VSDVRLEITEIPSGSDEFIAAAAWAASNGSRKISVAEMQADDAPPLARSVQYWVDNWGGYVGSLKGPDGSEQSVSLEPWRDRDPEATFVRIHFIYRDPKMIGTRVTPTPK
jgi:hypothetical protein